MPYACGFWMIWHTIVDMSNCLKRSLLCKDGRTALLSASLQGHLEVLSLNSGTNSGVPHGGGRFQTPDNCS